MPANLDTITPINYNPLDPYHHSYDNAPLNKIVERQSLINIAVNQNTNDIRTSAGTSGSLNNRLSQSIADNGSLKVAAVNSILHNIAHHADGVINISGTDISFVRMKKDERDKLELIASEATGMALTVVGISETVEFEDETITLQGTNTVSWEIESPSTLKAHLAFPASAAHSHHYNIDPVMVSSYTDYKTTSVATAFVSGSLRVYINGTRIHTTDTVYVPDSTGPDGTWTLTKIASETPISGLFSLNRAITVNDIIKIDFDESLV